MKVIEIGNLAIAANKIEGVQLMPGPEQTMVKVFLGSYGHNIPFDNEAEAVNFYALVLAEMKYS